MDFYRVPKGQLRLTGPFQQLVLLALIRLGGDTHATGVRRHLMHVTHRRVALSAVHTTLARLVAKGYAASWKRPNFWRPGRYSGLPMASCRDRDRPGPRDAPRNIRRFFRVTGLGRCAVRRTLAALESMLPGLPGFSKEHELFTWRNFPDPSPRLDRLLRRIGRRMGGISWIPRPDPWS